MINQEELEDRENRKNRERFENKLKIRQINSQFDWIKEEGLSKPYMPRPISDETLAFEGGYGRIGIIWIDYQTCICCKDKKQCLIVDQSEGEYHQASICFECIDLLRRVNE